MTVVPGRVSVLVPCHNGARYLGEALDSALGQTHGDVEILVADDGSTDTSAAVARAYGPRVRCLAQENRGPSAARNLALGASTGEYVALLDADDRFHPRKLARQVELLAARPDAGAAYCGWRFIDADGDELPERGWPRVEGDLLPQLLLGNLFHPVSVVLRREVVERAGGFDERWRVNEDWALFLEASRQGARWVCVDEALCDYRLHPGQSHQRLALVHAVALEILERFFADPTLPAALRRLEPEAYEQADLRAAAEFYAADAQVDGDRALARAITRRPAILGDAAFALRLLRMLLPDGHRSRAAVVSQRRRLLAMLRPALVRVARSPAERWRGRAMLLRLALRLRWRALTRGAGAVSRAS
ncbi:MAG: glycosyltransferase [bacterium]|nr:glycosyltransferase [bacterium]